MGLFKKLFKSQERAAERSWTKRAPRVRVLPLHRVAFSFTDPTVLGSPMVVNLSLEGIGLHRVETAPWPAKGSVVSGGLTVREERYPVSFEIMYVGESLVGGRFREIPSNFKERILSHFFAEFAALKMSEIKKELLQEDPDGTPHFFLGENGCELFYVENSGNLIHFHLVFFGNYIEGDKEGRVRVGMLEGEGKNDGLPGYKGSSIVHAARPMTSDVAIIAHKFLSNVEGLDSLIRESMAQRIAGAVGVSSL